MTKEQLNKEMLYHASISPFKAMLENDIIFKDDYRAIDTIMRVKYSPIFIGKSYQIPLDNKLD